MKNTQVQGNPRDMQEQSPWWVRQGYPPFAADRSGYPKAGQVLKYYREHTKRDDGHPWTQADLACVLDVTTKAINEMENKDKGMDSINRRQFLADLFSIPPVLLGITSLDTILAQTPLTKEQAPIIVHKKLLINTTEYSDFLAHAWSTYYSASPVIFLADIETRLDLLYKALPFAQGTEAEHISGLLSEYHRALASTLRDLRRYDEAIEHAHRAVLLVQHGTNAQNYAAALYMRGLSHVVRADFPPLPIGSIQAEAFSRKHLAEAQADFETAYTLSARLGLHQRGDICIKVATARARLATDYSAKKEAISLLDSVGTLARRSANEEDPLSYKLNEDHFHLERAATLVAIGWSDAAFDSLALVNMSSGDIRRVAYCDLLLTQAYLAQGNYPAALGAAEEALPLEIAIESDTNIGRLTTIYSRLKATTFAKNPELARFGMQLSRYGNKYSS